MVEVSSMGGERTFCGRVLLSLAGPHARICRSVRWIGDSGRRVVEGGNSGGRRSRVGRTIIGEAHNFGTSNNERIEIVDIDVRPLKSVVHSGEGGEIAGGRLVGASVPQINLATEGSPVGQRNTN